MIFQIKEILKFKDLIILLVKRDFKVFYKQTLLGPLWYIVQPLIYTLVFTIILGDLHLFRPTEYPTFFSIYLEVIWTFLLLPLTSTGNVFFKYHELFFKSLFSEACNTYFNNFYKFYTIFFTIYNFYIILFLLYFLPKF